MEILSYHVIGIYINFIFSGKGFTRTYVIYENESSKPIEGYDTTSYSSNLHSILKIDF